MILRNSGTETAEQSSGWSPGPLSCQARLAGPAGGPLAVGRERATPSRRTRNVRYGPGAGLPLAGGARAASIPGPCGTRVRVGPGEDPPRPSSLGRARAGAAPRPRIRQQVTARLLLHGHPLAPQPASLRSRAAARTPVARRARGTPRSRSRLQAGPGEPGTGPEAEGPLRTADQLEIRLGVKRPARVNRPAPPTRKSRQAAARPTPPQKAPPSPRPTLQLRPPGTLQGQYDEVGNRGEEAQGGAWLLVAAWGSRVLRCVGGCRATCIPRHLPPLLAALQASMWDPVGQRHLLWGYIKELRQVGASGAWGRPGGRA